MTPLVGPINPNPGEYDADSRLTPDHAAVEFIARIILETEPRTYLSSVDIERRLGLDRAAAGRALGELRDSTISPLVVVDERPGARGRKKFKIEFNDERAES